MGLEWCGGLGVGPEMFPSEGASKGGNISNQAEVIKQGLHEKEESLVKNRGLKSDDRLIGEVNNIGGRRFRGG